MESLSPWSLLNKGTLLIEEPLARIGNLIIYQGMVISEKSEKPEKSKVLIHELFPNDILSRVHATPKLRLISTEKAAEFEREKVSFNNGFEELKRSLRQNNHGLYTADLFSENGTVYAIVGYKPDQVIVDDLYWDIIKKGFRDRSSSKTLSISDLWKNVMEAAERQSPARSPEKSLELGTKTNSEKKHEEQTKEQGVPFASDMGRSRKTAKNPEANQHTRSSNKKAKDDGIRGTITDSNVQLKDDQGIISDKQENGQNADKTDQDWDVLLGLGAFANQEDENNSGNSNQVEDIIGGQHTSDTLKNINIAEDPQGRTSGDNRERKIILTRDRAQKIIIALFVIIIIQVVILLLGGAEQNGNNSLFSYESNYCNSVNDETILFVVQVDGGTTS